MERERFQKTWEEIVDRGFANYEQLSMEERVWFNVEPLTTGGVMDHYINYGADHNKDTIEDLEYLGAKKVARLMKKINKKFKGGVPDDIDDRNDQISKMRERFLERLDNKYWEYNDELESSLLNHIIAHFKED